MDHHKILELYSGIGGMHCAWKESQLKGEVVAAIDINTVANEVYHHNFPETNLLNKNIQSLNSEKILKLQVDTILMSPPCQPFTRNGKYLDENDPRTNSFLYILDILPQLSTLKYILLENVKGFECSSVRNQFIIKLKECGFEYQDFLLCPSNVGVPNSRLRYYCIARRNSTPWHFKRKNEIMTELPDEFGEPYPLEQILETNVSEKYLVPDNKLRKANVLDICYKDSKRSCCFTKAYSHYIEGMGSVFTEASPNVVKECFDTANTYEVGSEEFVNTVKSLKLRFFTPKEVSCLMSFPEYYKFPESITTKQCYRLLGNSINCKVVTELLKLLYNE